MLKEPVVKYNFFWDLASINLRFLTTSGLLLYHSVDHIVFDNDSP